MITQTIIDFDGHSYNREKDAARLTGQVRVVLDVLKTASFVGQWLTVEQIKRRCIVEHDEVYPEASISAQIRNLRKARFGAWPITGRYRDGVRIYEYLIECIK